MKEWHRWNRRVAAGLIGAAAAVAGFNLVLDPYSVFKSAEWLRQGYNLNERFRKIEHLRENIGKHDSFILGASTMGLFPIEEAQSMRPGSSWYNLAFLAGTPPEALRALQFLKSSGEPIKEVMFGIDIFAFRKLTGSNEMWKREHPLVSGESWLSWYKSHVFASSFLFGVERVLHNLNPAPRLHFDVNGTGRYFLPRWDNAIKADEAKFIKEQIYERNKNGGKEIQKSRIVLVQERFDELGQLKAWLDQNGVKSHFWINPMHWKNLETIEPSSLEAFRRKVRKAVGEVPDYSTRTDITGDDRKFYEWQHFRPSTAALITHEVLGQRESTERQPGNAVAQSMVGSMHARTDSVQELNSRVIGQLHVAPKQLGRVAPL